MINAIVLMVYVLGMGAMFMGARWLLGKLCELMGGRYE